FLLIYFFSLNDPSTSEIFTLSLHDALPIFSELLLPGAACLAAGLVFRRQRHCCCPLPGLAALPAGQSAASGLSALAAARHPADRDRKSTRLNSSHVKISYAVFCLKKKKI